MTYGRLLAITKGLLTGDNTLPVDNEVLLGLLEYAFYNVSVKAQSLHLMTMNRSKEILRLSEGDYLMRLPKLPGVEGDILDIDDELGFPTARFIASFISKDRGGIHVAEANRLINDYNGKVYEIMDSMRIQNEEAECGLQQTFKQH